MQKQILWKNYLIQFSVHLNLKKIVCTPESLKNCLSGKYREKMVCLVELLPSNLLMVRPQEFQNYLMARGTSPESSYIRDFSRQWVLPNAKRSAILDCSSCFCCLAFCPLTGLFLTGHDGAPQETIRKTKTLHVFHSDLEWHAIV